MTKRSNITHYSTPVLAASAIIGIVYLIKNCPTVSRYFPFIGKKPDNELGHDDLVDEDELSKSDTWGIEDLKSWLEKNDISPPSTATKEELSELINSLKKN